VLYVLQVDERNVSTCELVNKEENAHSISEMVMVVENVNWKGQLQIYRLFTLFDILVRQRFWWG
jgi:transcription elongation factor